MTFAQRSASAHRSTSSVREPPCEREHNATDQTATMSDPGLVQNTSMTLQRHDPASSASVHTTYTRDVSTQTPDAQNDSHTPAAHSEKMRGDGTTKSKRTRSRAKPVVSLEDFAEHLRVQRHLEHRQRVLQGRKRVLQKTITLSARLHRLSSWLRDGLVEISMHSDASGFVRVHQHMQDLVDLAYSQWNHELHALNPLDTAESDGPDSTDGHSFLPKLSSNAQSDLLALISCLRSQPKFLVERFRSLSHSQITALSTFPRYSDVSESVLTSFQARGRVSQERSKRILTFSKALETYASSFERSNPLSFLLFNIYGTDQSLSGPENKLRLSTWSTVCAELLSNCDEAYQALLPQLLSSFASLHEWRVKEGVELFLMDVLQRGAFILDLVGKFEGPAAEGYDPLNTQQAQDFFQQAILDLFAILTRLDGGFPIGALQLASAVLSKLQLEEQQMRFRGEFFSRWFLEQYLRIIVTYPENENMLLKFHISKDARDYILYPLWAKIDALVTDTFSASPSQEVPDEFRYYVSSMINTLGSIVVEDPYKSDPQETGNELILTPATITVCPSEIVQVLEALSPQAMHGPGLFDPFLTSSTSTFHAQFSHASIRFDRLRRELGLILEPGSSASSVHPCQEQWLHLAINTKGEPLKFVPVSDDVASIVSRSGNNLDLAQHAALRLCNEASPDALSKSTSYRTNFAFSNSLETAFQDMIVFTRARNDPVARIFWEDALDALTKNYPLSNLIQDDSAVLRTLVNCSKEMQAERLAECTTLETELSSLEDMSMRIRTTVTQFMDRFEELKLKLWYSLDVISSDCYEDAKNITKALNNMALSMLRKPVSGRPSTSSSRRPMSSRSTTSSFLAQSLEDTMSMLKAPQEHGGPKKLADAQIENTKKWLQRSNVDNFCRGEERIHRFCMEVATVSRKLVGESLADTPVLWSSKLFAREQSYHDMHSFGVTSAPASTRPASFMSETFSTTIRSSRPVYRSNDSARMALIEDRRSPTRRVSSHGTGSGRIDRGILPPELASSIGTASRAFSATTAESISTFWSPLPSNTRSMTSASVYSRPASMFNDAGLSRFTDTAREKTKFLEKTQRALICLLLSDLGCPVWSLGSETDAWLGSSRCGESVNHRLGQRIATEHLVTRKREHVPGAQRRPSSRSSRRSSLPGIPMTRKVTNPSRGVDSTCNQEEDSHIPRNKHLEGLEELLAKLSQQVDPIEKLIVVEEFYNLSVSYMQSELDSSRHIPTTQSKLMDHHGNSRRSSLDLQAVRSRTKEKQRPASKSREQNIPKFSEQEIVQQLKLNFTKLRPKTLFRDLQYIAAFVPTEMTDKTLRGEAFLRLGLAALDYKDEVCRAMVDIANSVVTRDAIKRLESSIPAEPTLTKAIEYWMLAAKEGSAVAQREVALLYLSHAQLLPIITRPLSASSEIFKGDRPRRESDDRNLSPQALCLALHWMQQAADGGDQLAQRRLDERKAAPSIP